MKSVFISVFTIILSVLISSHSVAQQWEPPFKIETDSLLFALPQTKVFSDYDSAFVLLKVQFHENENRIQWLDLLRFDLFKRDSVVYNFFNDEITSDWSKSAMQTDLKTYPDSITTTLFHYLDEKVKEMEFEPTKYVDEYRLIPVSIPVRLNLQKKPAY